MTTPRRVSPEQLEDFRADAQLVANNQLRIWFEDGQVRQTAITEGPRGSVVRIKLDPPGRRYVRLVPRGQRDAGVAGPPAAYGFIDLSNGCVLRAASWDQPDPIPRGNLLDATRDPSLGRAALDREGIRYLDDPALDPDMLAKLRAAYAPQTLTDAQVQARPRPSADQLATEILVEELQYEVRNLQLDPALVSLGTGLNFVNLGPIDRRAVVAISGDHDEQTLLLQDFRRRFSVVTQYDTGAGLALICTVPPMLISAQTALSRFTIVFRGLTVASATRRQTGPLDRPSETAEFETLQQRHEALRGRRQVEQLAILARVSEEEAFAFDDAASAWRAEAGHAEHLSRLGDEVSCAICGRLEAGNPKIDLYYHPLALDPGDGPKSVTPPETAAETVAEILFETGVWVPDAPRDSWAALDEGQREIGRALAHTLLARFARRGLSLERWPS